MHHMWKCNHFLVSLVLLKFDSIAKQCSPLHGSFSNFSVSHLLPTVREELSLPVFYSVDSGNWRTIPRIPRGEIFA